MIGAGAAGLFAATAAAERGHRVLLLEKQKKPGVKILASGGTKCNVTSTLPIDRLAKCFGRRAERFLKHGLFELSPFGVRKLLEEEGVPTKTYPMEKVFPESGKASDVLDAFLRRAERAGVKMACGEPVMDVETIDDGTGLLRVRTNLRTLATKRLIVTSGGKSYPKTGTTGDGYRWLEKLGHTIVAPRPALCPLVVDLPWVRSLTGIAAEDAIVRAVSPKSKVLFERRRPVLFTHRGLSGPGPMDVSKFVTGLEPEAELVIDWLPKIDMETIDKTLQNPRQGAMLVFSSMPGDLPKRLIRGLFEHANVPTDRTIAQLKRDERVRLATALKACKIPVKGDEGWDKAEVTAGGVELDEVDPRTMQSRKTPGLFIAGEILDLDGPIGGFNFQAAFSTGRCAGIGVHVVSEG